MSKTLVESMRETINLLEMHNCPCGGGECDCPKDCPNCNCHVNEGHEEDEYYQSQLRHAVNVVTDTLGSPGVDDPETVVTDTAAAFDVEPEDLADAFAEERGEDIYLYHMNVGKYRER